MVSLKDIPLLDFLYTKLKKKHRLQNQTYVYSSASFLIIFLCRLNKSAFVKYPQQCLRMFYMLSLYPLHLWYPEWLFIFTQFLVWIHDTQLISPGPKQGLALPKTPGTYLPGSLPTSKTLSLPGQVPFLAYYILPYTFSVFSPLSSPVLTFSLQTISWKMRLNKHDARDEDDVDPVVFSRAQDIGSVSSMLRERRPQGEQVSLTGDSRDPPLSPCSFPELEEEEEEEAADLPPAHPSSHCKADQRPRANSWVIWAIGPL